MPYILVGNRYIGPSSLDPGSTGFGYEWEQTDTGLVFNRNQFDTGWVPAGDTSQNNLGLITLDAGNVSGALTGKHGLMPTDASSPFTATPNVNGTSVALITDLTTAMDAVSAQITTIVNRHAANAGTVAIRKHVQFWQDYFYGYNTGASDPSGLAFRYLPITKTYPDGTPIAESECIVWVMPDFFGVTLARIRTFHVVQGQSPLYWKVYYTTPDGSGGCIEGNFSYAVFAIKTGA